MGELYSISIISQYKTNKKLNCKISPQKNKKTPKSNIVEGGEEDRKEEGKRGRRRKNIKIKLDLFYKCN